MFKKSDSQTKSWKTGELAKGKSDMLQVYDNWDILSIRAEYKDVLTLRNVTTKNYYKPAKLVSQNHIVIGNLGSNPRLSN